MNKKISYILLTFSIIFLAFSIYYMADYIKADVTDQWVLEDVVQVASEGNVLVAKEEDVKDVSMEQLIGKIAADPSIKKMIEETDIDSIDYEKLRAELGVDMRSTTRGVIMTNAGGTIIILSEDQSIKYKWTNRVLSGTIELIIKDVNNNIIYENDKTNISVQDEIVLPAGCYFASVNWDVQQEMSYNLYISGK